MKTSHESETATINPATAMDNGTKLYYKLHECLKVALTAKGVDLSPQANLIVCQLAKSIESGATWYDGSAFLWCCRFLQVNG